MQIENSPFSYLVQFDTGTPLGEFSYTLYDDNGDPIPVVQNKKVTPAPGAVSVLIEIPPQANTLTKPLFEGRSLTWFYTTALGPVNGSYGYTIRKRVPFPVTAEGVRTKLGVDDTEIPDSRIDLLMSYVEFSEGVPGIEDYADDGSAMSLKITNAIESIAALKLLPTLQLSIAKRLTSGTNEYERFAKIDWDMLANQLNQNVYDVSVLIDPTLVYVATDVFALAVRTDPFTGV